MADPERFERPTPRFVVWCSIQLSYGSAMGGHLPFPSGACKRGKQKNRKKIASGERDRNHSSRRVRLKLSRGM